MKNAKTVSRNRISLDIKQELVTWAKAYLNWQDLDLAVRKLDEDGLLVNLQEE